MLSCELMGGLGNQLFQVAATLSLGKDLNRECIFPSQPDQKATRKISYNTSFFHKLNTISQIRGYHTHLEKQFHYVPINIRDRNTQLKGYFQSEKYFEKNKDYIINTLTLPKKFQDNIKQKYKDIVEHPSSVSVHVRRGDYVKLQDYHVILSIDYYKKAIDMFNSKSLFVIFSDDIEWCKNNEFFQSLPNKVFITDLDYNELYLMSLCKHNVIANSTFSWWGAYLNRNIRKMVIYPSIWFGVKHSVHNTKDLIPDGWVKI